MADAICSSVAACCSVRCDRSLLPTAMSASHLLDDTDQIAVHLLHALYHPANLTLKNGIDPARQFAQADALQAFGDFVESAFDGLVQRKQQQHSGRAKEPGNDVPHGLVLGGGDRDREGQQRAGQHEAGPYPGRGELAEQQRHPAGDPCQDTAVCHGVSPELWLDAVFGSCEPLL
jgi:hypothetical protein